MCIIRFYKFIRRLYVMRGHRHPKTHFFFSICTLISMLPKNSFPPKNRLHLTNLAKSMKNSFLNDVFATVASLMPGALNLEQLTFSQGQCILTPYVSSCFTLGCLLWTRKGCQDDQETDPTWFWLRRAKIDRTPKIPVTWSERRRGEEIGWERDWFTVWCS